MSAPISVVLVDDDAMVRTALSMILGAAPEITVVAQADDGRRAVVAVDGAGRPRGVLDLTAAVALTPARRTTF